MKKTVQTKVPKGVVKLLPLCPVTLIFNLRVETKQSGESVQAFFAQNRLNIYSKQTQLQISSNSLFSVKESSSIRSDLSKVITITMAFLLKCPSKLTSFISFATQFTKYSSLFGKVRPRSL